MEQQKENPNNPVAWFEIHVDDLNRGRKFYETVLDIKMQDLSDPDNTHIKLAAFPMKMNVPNASGWLAQIEGVKAGGDNTIVYFGSADCAKEEARVEKAGGKIFRKKMPIGEFGFVSLCRDTEGNMFGIHSMK
jgi:uncharacterized protein